MPPRKHAILSASSAHRWLHCSPSARLEQDFEDSRSEAAAEGTAAHAQAEHKLRRALKRQSRKPVSAYDNDEMNGYTDDYAQFVIEMLADVQRHCPDALLLIEQKLDFSCYVPDGFGTGDALIVADDTLHIIDLKYGQGILVEAERNPQMMLYALGALSLFDGLYDIQTVSMTIYQPRRENISTWSVPVMELMEWAENTLRPMAIQAFEGKGEYNPGAWCVFCKAAARCRARAEANLALAKHEFTMPPLLTDAEIGEVLSQLDELIKWADELKAYALDGALHHGKIWPGWKLVEGRSIRKYANEDAVIEAANAAGYKDIYRKTLLPITEMEKLMGKQTFAEVLGGCIHKPAGKPTLVPESDKRLAINTANTDFHEYQED
ncbi:DUF2800 domain-containing protein [Eubacteriales bacterium OttesenSCG-928-N13]|nr:DUF2800 domain-containing protein [Eubacteriales bacterium OttesenSCG-928-N13]